MGACIQSLKWGYNRFNAIFAGRTAVDAFCAWQLSQCGWMENGRRASGANAPIVATNLLWWRETAPPWSQKDRIHRVHHFTFASGAVSVFTCVHFPAGSRILQLQFSFDVVGFEEFAFYFFCVSFGADVLRSALLLRPSLLYQRSVKRRHHWACPMCLCGTLRWSGGGGVVEGLLPSWKFHF